MAKILIIGCGGVASVAIQKCAKKADVFSEICIASRTVSKCDALKEKLEYYRPFEQRAQKAEAEAAQLRRERFSSAEARSRLENENRRLQRENDAQRRFMETVKDREGRSMLDAYEARKAAQKRGQEWSR